MVMKTKVRGKAFVFGKNIDTDQIYPGRFVEYTDVEDIKKYAIYAEEKVKFRSFHLFLRKKYRFLPKKSL